MGYVIYQWSNSNAPHTHFIVIFLIDFLISFTSVGHLWHSPFKLLTLFNTNTQVCRLPVPLRWSHINFKIKNTDKRGTFKSNINKCTMHHMLILRVNRGQKQNSNRITIVDDLVIFCLPLMLCDTRTSYTWVLQTVNWCYNNKTCFIRCKQRWHLNMMM